MDDAPQAESGPLWLSDEEPRSPRPERWSARRLAAVATAAVACLAVVGVPVGLVLTSGTVPATVGAPAQHRHHPHEGPAARKLITALGATVDSGSFNVTYSLTEACSAATTATARPAPDSCTNTPGLTQPISGTAVIDTDPFGMVTTSTVTGLGKITLYDNGTNVWEDGGGDYGLTPKTAGGGPGQSLSGFATLVENTLGKRLGAMAMQGLSSPTGYLDLQQQEVVGATAAGTGTVDGTPVTEFQFSVTTGYSPTPSLLTSEEAKAIAAAGQVEQSVGYTGATILVSVDASGFIRRTHTEIKFSDGAVATITATFSDFGCAGTVAMPGSGGGGGTAPSGCVSPDTGLPPATTTTTGPATNATTTTTTATSGGSTTTTTATSGGSTTTTVAPTTTIPAKTPPLATTTTTGGG